MPTITFSCGAHVTERQFSIMKAPPSEIRCETCEDIAPRVWEAAQFICDKADADVDHVPEQYRVSDKLRPESREEGRRMERAFQADMDKTRREVAEGAGSSVNQTHKIPAHLYHGKIKQTGDRNYWLDSKNRDKHKSTRVDTYGRNRRGKG